MSRPIEKIFVTAPDRDLAKKEARWEQTVAALLEMFSSTTAPEHD